jgi:hypothetical protein
MADGFYALFLKSSPDLLEVECAILTFCITLAIMAFVILVVVIAFCSKIKKDLRLYYSLLNDALINHDSKTDRMIARIESVSQRISVLNDRLKRHFQQFGIEDIEKMKPTHFVKNKSRRKGRYDYYRGEKPDS